MCKLFSICILLLILISCTSSEVQTDGQIPVIDIEANINNFKFVNLSELTDDIEYIPLETTKEYMLGQINNLVITEDRFVISGPYYCKTFDRQGKYLNDIGSKGQGPGQYITIGSPSIDYNVKRIYIKVSQNQIFEYTLDGEFIRSIKCKLEYATDYISDIYFIKNGIYGGVMNIRRGRNPNVMYFFNENGNILKALPNSYYKTGNENIVPLYIYNYVRLFQCNKLLYKDSMSDTLYYLNDDLQLIPYYYFKLGKCGLPNELLIQRIFNEYPNSMDDLIKKENEYIAPANFITETKNYILFACNFGNYLPESEAITKTYYYSPGAFSPGGVVEGISRIAGGLYYKENSKVVFLKKHNGFYGLKNDIDGGMPLWPHAQAYKEQLVRVCEPTDLKNWINSVEFKASTPLYPERKVEFENMVRNLDDMDNPVLMVVTLRNE